MKFSINRYVLFCSLLSLSGSVYGMAHAAMEQRGLFAVPAVVYARCATHSAASESACGQMVNSKSVEKKKIKKIYNVRLLRQLLERGQFDVVADLLKEAYVGKRYNGGETLLHTAVRVDAVKIIRPLIATGMDPNVQDKFGNTPLHAAFFLNRTNAISELLAVGARADIANRCGDTPVRFASEDHLRMFPVLGVVPCSAETVKSKGYDACAGRSPLASRCVKAIGRGAQTLWNLCGLIIGLELFKNVLK